MDTNTNYKSVFKKLHHLVALTKNGQTKTVIDNLITTVLAVGQRKELSGASEAVEAVQEFFRLTIDERTIVSSLGRLVDSGAIKFEQETSAYILDPSVKVIIGSRVENAVKLENKVRDEWLNDVEQTHQNVIATLPLDWKNQLWKCLQEYMAKAFQRHGVETIQLIDSSATSHYSESEGLAKFLDEAIRVHDIPELFAREAVTSFFRQLSLDRTAYLVQLLDGTFSFFALTVDKATSEYLRSELSPLQLFMDTNFIFGILRLHNNSFVDVSHELVRVIQAQKLPFSLYFHEETLLELKRTIKGTGERLQSRIWSSELSRAALANSEMLTGIEIKFHRDNLNARLNPKIWLSRFNHVESLLLDEGFKKWDKKSANKALYDERKQLVLS